MNPLTKVKRAAVGLYILGTVTYGAPERSSAVFAGWLVAAYLAGVRGGRWVNVRKHLGERLTLLENASR